MLKKFNKEKFNKFFYKPELKKDNSKIIIKRKLINNNFPISKTFETNNSILNKSKGKIKKETIKNNNNIPLRFLPLIKTQIKKKIPNLIKKQVKLERIYKDVYKIDKELNKVKRNNSVALEKDFSLIDYQEKLIHIFGKKNFRVYQDGTIAQLRKNFIKINNYSFGFNNRINKNNSFLDIFRTLNNNKKEIKKSKKYCNSSSYL